MIDEIKIEFDRQFTNYYNGLIELAPKLLVATAVLFLFYLLSRLLKPVIRKRLKTRLEDVILAEFFTGVIHFTFISLGVLVGIQIIGLGALVVGIFSGAGVAAIVLGFAFKDIGENFIAGIIMAFNRPFKTGDMIQLDNQRGRVLRMSIRETHIKTSDGKDVFIPNASILKGNLINYTVDGALRYDATIGVDYGSDMPKCFSIIEDVLTKIEGVLPSPAPSANIATYTANGLDVQFTFWIDIFALESRRFKVKTQAFYKVWEALNEAGYVLPGEIVELKNYSNKSIVVDTNIKTSESR